MKIVYNKNNEVVKEYENKYNLFEGDRVEVEVFLNSKDKKKRRLYFFIQDKWEEVVFNGLPESIKFAV